MSKFYYYLYLKQIYDKKNELILLYRPNRGTINKCKKNIIEVNYSNYYLSDESFYGF